MSLPESSFSLSSLILRYLIIALMWSSSYSSAHFFWEDLNSLWVYVSLFSIWEYQHRHNDLWKTLSAPDPHCFPNRGSSGWSESPYAMQFVMYMSLGGRFTTGELSIAGDAVVVAASSSGSAKWSMIKVWLWMNNAWTEAFRQWVIDFACVLGGFFEPLICSFPLI